MKLRVVGSVISLIALVGVVLGIALFGPAFLSPANDAPGGSQTAAIAGNAIERENAQLGTSTWKISVARTASTQIQAYANATSVQPGKTLTFYVSTQQEGTHFLIDIYRLGWYGGDGGRLMTSIEDQVGHAQGYYDASTHQLIGCSSCLVDKKTGLVEANWRPSYTLAVPANWTTGVYLAKLTDANGLQTYVPFDVLSNSNSRYVVVTPDTTYAAYNDWGGYSLYSAANGQPGETTVPTRTKADKVSFDRPYTQEAGSSQVLAFEADAIHWMERQSYDLSYISDIDLHNDPGQLLHHSVYISIGHDEYWTKEMRDGVEQARDHGVGLAFLGANASYWQVRFERDSAGAADRTVVCYKVSTSLKDLARDPLYRKDNSRVTAQWRDPVLARPENALIGIMYAGFTPQRLGFPWVLSPSANSPLLNGTDLQAGRQYGCDLVGYEWDRIFPNGATPAGLQVLATSNTANSANNADTSNTTYYIAESGAMIFATGSINWTAALDNYQLHPDTLCPSSQVVPGAQKLMANVMEALALKHPMQ